MRTVRFRDPSGSVRVGRWDDDGVSFGGRHHDLEEVDVLAPVEPSKIVCVGVNYTDHADETDSAIPDRPVLFLKTPNAVASHGSTIVLPRDKERIDYEGELGVVIDVQCRNVPQEDAMSVVRGYTCANDLSNRDDQRIEQNWVRGKSFDSSAPIGPVVADPAGVPDDASIEVRVNDEVRQRSTIDNLIFSIPELIQDITSLITLEPGDVILTGTPAGVGPVNDDDTIEVEIDGIGTLVHDVVAGEFAGEIEHDFMPDL